MASIRPLVLGALLFVSPFAGAAGSDATVRIRTSTAGGLGPGDGVARLAPSDILRLGGRDHVLYARAVPAAGEAPGASWPWRAEIWQAVSDDLGHSWQELGPVLRPGPPGALDSVGVFDPGVLRWTDGTWYLYYAGVGEEYNPRLEAESPVTPVRLFCARLSLDAETGGLRAERLNRGRPVLEPSARSTRRFDSLRVQDPRPLLHEGRVALVHEGMGFGAELALPQLGVAVGPGPTGPFEQRLEGRAALPAGGDALIGAHEGGLFALVTGSGRGLWWAADGEHLVELDARVNGRLSDPGIFRGDIEGCLLPGRRRWGLHVASTSPLPYLERFELEVQGELSRPEASRVPVPGHTALDSWSQPGWMAQHLRTLEVPRRGPIACVVLGDGLVEGWGGHDRLRDLPGAASWPEPRPTGRLVNLGIAGDHTENVLWRLSHGALEGLRAGAVMVAVGSEQLHEDGPSATLSGIEAIRDWIQREHPGTHIALVSVLPRPTEDAAGVEAARLCNEGVARLARRDPWTHHLDLAALLAGPDGRPPLSAWDARGYLSPASYSRWAKGLEGLLDRLETLSLDEAELRLRELRGPTGD
jgi:hypothetical protein